MSVSSSSISAEKIAAIDPQWKWEEAEPLPIRPFVNKRNFTISMGIHNLSKTPEEWLLIENTYMRNTQLRKSYSGENPEKTLLCYDNPRTSEAVKEFYDLTINFLVNRYPQYFVDDKQGCVENLISKEKFPSSSDHHEAKELITYFPSLIEEDIVINLKDDPENEENEYILRGAVNAYPMDVDPRVIHNQPITFIHGRVPEYPVKLQSPMHSFFNKLQPKDLWVRYNWSIIPQAGPDVKELKGRDIENTVGCLMRVERQCLTKLPKSQAMIMTIRGYMTPLAKVKEEGSGPELIRAIDSLPEDFASYKNRNFWGTAVKEYLST